MELFKELAALAAISVTDGTMHVGQVVYVKEDAEAARRRRQHELVEKEQDGGTPRTMSRWRAFGTTKGW